MRTETPEADAGVAEVATDGDPYDESWMWALLTGDGFGLCEPTGAGWCFVEQVEGGRRQ